MSRATITVPECDGRCCAVFPIPAIPHGELGPGHGFSMLHGDMPILMRMLRPVGDDEAAQLAADAGQSPRNRYPDAMYACRWWDRDTRRCLNYEGRPDMCRAYPYGSACEHCGGGPRPVLPEPLEVADV